MFGAGAAVDAFLVAQGLMNLVLGLIAGALAKAAVPVVARAVDRGEAAAGVASVRAALGLSGVVLLVGGGGMWVGAPGVVGVLAPGFDAATAEVAVGVTRVVLVATVLISGTNLLAGAGQALGRFAPAAVQGVGFNLVMIAAAGVAGPVFGVGALAWGFVLGSAVRLVIQVPAVRAVVARPWPTLRWGDPGLREMLRLLPALLVGSAAANVNTLVDRAVASTIGDGAIAAVNFAARLVATVDMLVVATLLAALYPRLSAAVGRRAELRGLVERGMGALSAVLAPVAVVLAVVATEVVAVVFGRGEFDAAAVGLTGSVAAVLAVGLPVLAVREVAARTAYALGDGGIAVRSALAAMVVNVVGDLALAPVLGVTGIAAATVASGVVGAVVAVRGLARRHGAVPGLRSTVGGVLVAGAVAAALAVGARALLSGVGDMLLVAAVGLITLTGYLAALRFAAPRQFRLLADLPREVLRGR
ncbi:lipid II flippase MurJ [Actinokineospora sp. NPDC004072]